MNKKALIGIIAIAVAVFSAVVIISALGFGEASGQKTEPTDGDNNTEARFLDCRYFVETDFYRDVALAESYEARYLGAGVVPHHLLAGKLIASFFQTVRDTGKEIDTVVVIGPNHQGLGGDISTADCGWQTLFGALPCDKGLVNELLDSAALGVRVDNDLLETDHAVSGLIPYIKYYLPEANVATILMTRRVTLNQGEGLAELLAAFAEEKNILVVGSIDFSHGLSVEEGSIKDRQTLTAIQAGDLEGIKKMGNEHLDSPETLSTVLSYMKIGLGGDPRLLDHHNAADYMNREPDDCTTYFVLGCP